MPTLREEEYLEAIAAVVLKKGYAKVNDVASRLGVAPASVTEMFRRLSAGGFVNYEKYSGVTLTRAGMMVASKLSAKHEAIQELLVLMGVDPALADEDACRIEHNIHVETVECMVRFVEQLKAREKLRSLDADLSENGAGQE